ncbi:MAG: hypothetical protein IH986_12110 [Planctomycetes bacterium]|nr:hypothetical protein [Planctomycetota bacterium]
MTDVRPTILPDFHKQVLAVQRVEKLLLDVTRALDGAKIPYAVIGGNAVAAWVATVDEDAVRATKDVDLLLRRSDIAAATQALTALDLERVEVLGVTMFVDRKRPSPKKGVHIVFANEKVRGHYEHAAPDTAQSVRTPAGFVLIELASLVSMKLQAFRRIDQVHVEDLLAVDLIDDAVTASLPPDLLARLREIQETKE